MCRSVHRYLAHSIMLIIIIIITMSSLLASTGLSNVLAESPSFPNQAVVNAPFDWGASTEMRILICQYHNPVWIK
jgi:hypothetical protein